MDDMDEGACKNVYIDSRRKYRRFSGLVEVTPQLHSKRLKTDRSPIKENLINTTLTVGEDISNFLNETPPNLKLTALSRNFKINLNLSSDESETSSLQSPFKGKVGRPRKNKNYNLPIQKNEKPISKHKLGKSLKEKQGLTSLDGITAGQDKDILKLRREKNQNTDLNIAFAEEKNEIGSKLKTGGRERRQRRLSGVYKFDLNTGFIENYSINDENISPLEEILGINNCHEERPSSHDNMEEALETADADNKKDCCTTPVKSKLRKRQPRKITEEDIIKYYTDKTIKKRQQTLETIFETPKPDHVMSVKRYKRFINFNERMSNVKVKKRCGKIGKYNLWQNTHRVSAAYFARKLKEVDDL